MLIVRPIVVFQRVSAGRCGGLYQDVSVSSEIVYIGDERHEMVFRAFKLGTNVRR
jgi:hypothetical protein